MQKMQFVFYIWLRFSINQWNKRSWIWDFLHKNILLNEGIHVWMSAQNQPPLLQISVFISVRNEFLPWFAGRGKEGCYEKCVTFFPHLNRQLRGNCNWSWVWSPIIAFFGYSKWCYFLPRLKIIPEVKYPVYIVFVLTCFFSVSIYKTSNLLKIINHHHRQQQQQQQPP